MVPTKSNLGEKGFVRGDVYDKEQKFRIFPIYTKLRNARLFHINAYGIVSNDTIEIDFKASIIFPIIRFFWYGLFLYLFLSPSWIEAAWVTIPTVFLVLLINILVTLNSIKKDIRTHIEFICEMKNN